MTTAAFKALRRAVFARADGRCECGCGKWIDEASGHLDHFFGRGAGRPPEAVSNCWALHYICDAKKTTSDPNAAVWLARFMRHANAHGYPAEHDRADARFHALLTKGMGAL